MKSAFISLSSVVSLAALAVVAGCTSPAADETESSSQDIVAVTSAYTEIGKAAALDACKVTSEAGNGRGRRSDCGTMGDFTLVADERDGTTLPYVRTPTGTFDLSLALSAQLKDLHPGATKHGYFGKLAEWRGTGVAPGKVEAKALILRYFFYDQTSAGTFKDNNVLVVAKVSNFDVCVAGIVSGATSNHNQIARDIVDSEAFENGDCGEMDPEPLAPTSCGSLATYQGLLPDQSVSSCSQSHTLIMQGDGNLVLYNNNTGRATWNSKTVTGKANHWATLNHQGSLVVHDPSTFDAPFFTEPTSPGASLLLQDDGNLVIYSKAGEAIWASNTAGK